MAAKTPAPQSVSRLLAGAGFERGASRPEEQAADGYAVIPNRPGDGIVLVAWWGPDEERAGMLGRYAGALEDGGYYVRQSDDGAYLVVTARTGEE